MAADKVTCLWYFNLEQVTRLNPFMPAATSNMAWQFWDQYFKIDELFQKYLNENYVMRVV